LKIHLVRDEELSERQLSRRREFLRAVTFDKPYAVTECKSLLQKSGLSESRAKLVVNVSFFGSFALFIGFCIFFLHMFKGITETGIGFWSYAIIGLLFMYVTHFYLAKFLVRYFKAKR